ncbi:UDP-N-acetylglucosamine 2-epimerase (hydrolyzing) [Muricauda oceani]|uniref:UDP-N-acetylglucosamine 2-epimerase (Hydrolyzing) n=1 Tax=Flagellimonas oceani TaxID=2698672 RepID=A0A6G7J6A2_9FLAO|nr:UDP-N-acetylglucosamine 2-epimerase [Allomuricauda oceani]MBW8242637.1 UDP-N-acetylglucosamine 2-epimerase (hydrolyzing) [Allomuricauda oceani]QII46393.1 UDP-N-acetylglucosamine 2-epimerase (hydrolyzing) [Allomuricauda oceani]
MKRVAVVTGTRAEYGLLRPLISAIREDKSLDLKLLVTGMHLIPEFGNTYREIESDGFTIDAKIEDGWDGDSAKSITKSVGRALKGFAEVFDQLKPDLLVLLGDRTEILAAATAATIANIPIAHLHGGETTEGAYDEFIRHAITKMSHFHFASTQLYKDRIIQMGEHPQRVFNVGAIGVDSIKRLKLMSKNQLEESLGTKLKDKSALITFHPVTTENLTAERQFNQLLMALDDLKGYTLIFTKANSDKGGAIINKMIEDYVDSNRSKALGFASLGQLRYLSSLQYVDFVIGNSSSGILEVPYFEKPTINIGDRQKGRIMSDSIINCIPVYSDIKIAIKKAQSKEFLSSIPHQDKIYGNGDTTSKIINILRNLDLSKIQKPFYDLNHKHEVN